MGTETKGIVPWGLHPLKPWIIKELTNRAKEYDMNPVFTEANPYSGPRTAWARVFSNGMSNRAGAKDLDGFVLSGTFAFDESYGFNQTNTATIGVDAKGTPHVIDISESKADFPHRPPPSLTSVECELFGSQNASFPSLCRKVKINWRCFSLDQLNYLIPYFLTPRVTVLVEWGWNNYDGGSLVDLTDVSWMVSMFSDPTYILDYLEPSNGNYDAGIGFITDYGYELNEYGGYDCFTTITNTNFLIEGQAIHNQSVTGQKGNVQVPMKTFKEFVKSDLANIKHVSGMQVLKDLNISVLNLNRKIFDASAAPGNTQANQEKMQWIRMDLLVDIINAFSSVVMVGSDGQPKTANETSQDTGVETSLPVRLNNLTITGIKVTGHPALKSVDKNILFPNQFAPRLCTLDSVDKSNGSGNDITKQTISNVPYTTLFNTVGKLINQKNMDKSYDDLQSLINPYGDSFPVFKNMPGADGIGELKSGYWGYLSDVFISVDMIKTLVAENDTILKFVESILQRISQAMCNISQLKLVVSEYGNKYYSIVDTNLSPVNNQNDASKLMRISLGSVGSAFIRSAGFNVKVATEMMNQLVAQSANGKSPSSGTMGSMSNDPKRPFVSRGSAGDRLFSHGLLPNSVNSNSAVNSSDTDTHKVAELKRLFDDTNKTFYVYTKSGYSYNNKGVRSKVPKKYILAETDGAYMTQLLTGTADPHATYQNNAIMPGTEFTMEILGISGITYLSQFTLDHVPDGYDYKNAVWQVSDIKHKIEGKTWLTTITAQVRPLTTITT